MAANLQLKLIGEFSGSSESDRDYVSPGFESPDFGASFPHRIIGDKASHPWIFLRREVPHRWYVDERNPLMGFMSVDEASILHTMAKVIPDAEALEIGCHRGWSTAYMASGVKTLDVVDPVLADAEHRTDVESSLSNAGVLEKCALHSAPSPAQILQLAKSRKRPWSFIFVDGDHEPDGPLWDAQTVANHAARDAIVVFHDLASPVVAEGLAFLRSLGWSCLVLQTMQIMGVAWRGKVKIPVHVPDPQVNWEIPDHLRTFLISGESAKDYAKRVQEFFRDFSSSDPYARGRAPLPIGTPTLGAPSSDIRKLRADVIAAKAHAGELAAELMRAHEGLQASRQPAPDRTKELLARADETLARLDQLGILLSAGDDGERGSPQSTPTVGHAQIFTIESSLAAMLSKIDALSALIADDRQANGRLQSAIDEERRGADLLRGMIESERRIAHAMRAELEVVRAQTSDLDLRLSESAVRSLEQERVIDQLGNERKSLRQQLAQTEAQLKSRRFLLRRLLSKV